MTLAFPRRITTCLLALLSACLLSACANANDGVQGRDVTMQGNSFHVVSINLTRNKLALHWRDPASHRPYETIDTLKSWGTARHLRLLFAANAGIYAHNSKPLGLYVEKGRTVVPLNTAHGDPQAGNFSLLPNGVFAIDADGHASVSTTRDFAAAQAHPRLATQSGPMLVIDGQINPHFDADSTSVKWRSGVCAPSPDHVTFAISETPVNFHTFARLFRDKLGCRNALYLDGTISQMYDHGSYFGAPNFMVKPYAGMFAVFVPE